MSTVTSTVTAIGANALETNDPLVILFDQTATPELQDIAVIQKFTDPTVMQQLTLAEGDVITIDTHTYTIAYVGDVANQNLQTIGHITLLFAPLPASDRLGNGIYLTNTVKPEFHVGTKISYETD
ncbi:PTS glucitol/sorbitol transporter subunit IIA [Loigolactobacillus zhaoyuanensis]|uniref:PTS glucitol/sorbitol transporter subunit IIA n=1 Tax=Loigolactobacillus zhaoyuanensis TaxID=2486017 RepID=A0ABW8UED2_9LACO|nr:PTS glucitol/sorbitol transporter subunit IIA [Loigolactobacillus zhaoyuanensis]